MGLPAVVACVHSSLISFASARWLRLLLRMPPRKAIPILYLFVVIAIREVFFGGKKERAKQTIKQKLDTCSRSESGVTKIKICGNFLQ